MGIPRVNAVDIKYRLNLGIRDYAVFVLVDNFERFSNIKCLVTEECLSEGLDLTLLVENVFDETEEHHVLDAALLLLFLSLGFIDLILLFFSLAFLLVLLFKLEPLLFSAFTFLLNLLFSPESFLFTLIKKLLHFLFAFSDGQLAFLILNPYLVLEAAAFFLHQLLDSFSLLFS